MCWHICNHCNEVNNPDGDYGRDDTPCLWFIPGEDESGLQGCPYMTPGDGDEVIIPANWVAITERKALEFLSRPEYHDDSPLNKREHEYNQKYIDSYLDGE